MKKSHIKKQLKTLDKLEKLSIRLYYHEHIHGIIYDTDVLFNIADAIKNLKKQLGLIY